jgi:outer membrane protein assembly factor BamD (BamD/ComL family)
MRSLLAYAFITLALLVSGAAAQTDPKERLPLDQILEADANHNLDVAWQYFKLKKAYKAVILRTEETMAAHPTFSKMDEILYLSGMSSFYLSEGRGKQKINLERLPEEDRERYSPERLRSDAIALLSTLVEEHPESKYRDKAEKTLKKLKSD